MTSSSTRREAPRQLAVLAFFIVLTIAHTWPLATNPGVLSRNDNDDVVLNEWALAWVSHQAVTDPGRLFDANIFYPERWTLAYSEHLLPQAVFAAPVLWGGGSPVLAHNLALLVGMALTGWAMCWVVSRWTGSLAAGLVAGALAAFNAHSLTRMSHIQAQHLQYLPLALFALDRLLDQPKVRHALQTAVWFALQAMTSGYFLVFSAVALVVGAASRLDAWLGRNARRVVVFAVVAAVVAALLLLPTLWPYWKVRTEAGLVRPISEVAKFSASWSDYLATGARLHYALWSKPFFRADAMFPGVTAILLVAAAFVTGTALRDRRARMCLAACAVAVLFSFGPTVPLYAWLYDTVPLLQGIRGAARFGQLALVMFAAVAGFGMADVLRRIASPRRQMAAAAIAIALVTAESIRAPLGYYEYRGIPKVYDTLAGETGAVLVYFPMFSRRFIQSNSRYMLASTRHWHPMLNGYSGFTPASYMEHQSRLGGFPNDESLQFLRSLGVTHVVVDEVNLPPDRGQRARETPALRLLAEEGPLRIYRLAR
jgi:hypothetical protein